MDTKHWILNWISKNKIIKSRDVVKNLKISRQTASQHLRELQSIKKLTKKGTTLDSYYVKYQKGDRKNNKNNYQSTMPTRGLEEDRVFGKLNTVLGLKERLSQSAFNIISYAFTEMLNNAIDHSKASRVSIRIEHSQVLFRFYVKDRGVGVFESIRKKFRFKNHYEAIEHLLKGKQSTDPKRHSGQGIFFTSKISDKFILKSGNLSLTIDNEKQDTFIRKIPKVQGTEVQFELRPKTRKELKRLFDEYSNENFEFDRSKILVRLSPKEGEFVSRSEAKRLLMGLEKFQLIIFDFEKVPTIGQGFADEIFRVFQNRHPLIKLEEVNANPSIQFMIKRSKN